MIRRIKKIRRSVPVCSNAKIDEIICKFRDTKIAKEFPQIYDARFYKILKFLLQNKTACNNAGSLNAIFYQTAEINRILRAAEVEAEGTDLLKVCEIYEAISKDV